VRAGRAQICGRGVNHRVTELDLLAQILINRLAFTRRLSSCRFAVKSTLVSIGACFIVLDAQLESSAGRFRAQHHSSLCVGGVDVCMAS